MRNREEILVFDFETTGLSPYSEMKFWKLVQLDMKN